MSACTGNTSFKLYRNHRSKYADGASCDQNEFLEKAEKPYHGFLYFYGIEYGRMPDAYWGSAAFDGIYARGAFFLEYASVSGFDL